MAGGTADPRRYPRPRALRRLAGALAAAIVVFTPAAAAADPPRPTDFESRILEVTPALPPGVELSVIGGDAFVELEVSAGHEVVVPDYRQGDGPAPPYLRFGADGIVTVNDTSTAAVINESRYGSTAGTIDTDAPPAWREVSTNGTYAWHDHRVHWMSKSTPATMDDSRRVDMGGRDGVWSIDLVVDGSPTVVTGELLLLDAPSPIPWVGLGVLAAAVLALGAAYTVKRDGRPPHRTLAVVLAATSVGATVAGWAEWQVVPDGAGGSPLSAVVPAAAAVSAVVAALVGIPKVRLVMLLASVAALGGWAYLRREVVSRAILPTTLPFAADRAVTALALAVAGSVGAIVLWRPPATPRRVGSSTQT